MRRRTFDLLASSAGIVMTAVLILAGVLAFWGYSFANSNVEDNLRAQNIFFPPAESESISDPRIRPHIERYAGQQLVNGAQAEAYTNHYIAVHLEDTAGGKTYAETSTLARQNPGDAELQAQVQTLFRGETLRGLLLNAYAFWKFGQLALYGAIASFALAFLMLVATALGLWHVRRVSPKEEILAPRPANGGKPTPAQRKKTSARPR